MKKQLLLIAIVIVLALAIGWRFFVLTNSGLMSSDLAVYRNESYGFEISYPKSLLPENTFKQFYVLSNRWRFSAMDESSGVSVVAVPVFRVDQGGVATGKPYPLYFSAEVRVGVSSNPQEVADCYKNDPGYLNQPHEQVVLNGTTFEKFGFQDAAMMQYASGESYRVVHNNMCFAVEQVRAGSVYRDETMTEGISQEDLDAYYAQAGEIVRTFKFTK